MAQWSSRMIRPLGYTPTSWYGSNGRGPGFNSRLGPSFLPFVFDVYMKVPYLSLFSLGRR